MDQDQGFFLLKNNNNNNNLFIKGIYVILDKINLCVHNFFFNNLPLNVIEYIDGEVICTFPIYKGKIVRFNT